MDAVFVVAEFVEVEPFDAAFESTGAAGAGLVGHEGVEAAVGGVTVPAPRLPPPAAGLGVAESPLSALS